MVLAMALLMAQAGVVSPRICCCDSRCGVIGIRLVLGTLLALLVALPAQAALIRITPLGSPAPGYEESGAEVGPVLIGPDGFRLTYHGGGSQTLLDPVLLILGIPDADPGSHPSPPTLTRLASDPLITVTPYAHSSAYGATWEADGFVGTFDGSAGQNVYATANLITPSGGASQNYTNWNGATGLASWDLFIVAFVLDPDMQRGDWIEFSMLPGGLPVGSYVVGYGCTQYANGANPDDPACRTVTSKNEGTPFTFAGLVTTTVPEPATLTLLIPALGLLVARRRRDRRR
jgi:hypothetical protein